MASHRKAAPSALLLAALLAPPAASAAGFVAFDLPGSQLVALSSDGRVAAGTLNRTSHGGFRWRDGGRVELLAQAVSVHGLSPSGQVVAGSAFDRERRETATYWDQAGTPHLLGGLQDAIAQGGLLSLAFGASDQPSVVGIANDAGDRMQAFVWSPADGLRVLAAPPSAKGARARGVSADGHRIFGGYERPDGRYGGILWIDGTARALGDFDATAGEVFGADRAGRILLGTADGLSGGAYRWTESAGLKPLPPPRASLPPPLQAYAGSADGDVIVGSAGVGGDRVAVIWSETKAEPLADWLARHAVEVPPRWTLAAATAVSHDGRRIGGWGYHGKHIDSFVVDLPAAAAGSGAGGAGH